MEVLRDRTKDIRYWFYMTLVIFMVFMVCYHGLGIALKIFIPLALIVFLSHIFDFPKALVGATIVAAIVSLNFINIQMVSEYSLQIGIADLFVFLQILLLIVYRTLFPAGFRTKDIFIVPLFLFLIGATISVFVAQNKTMSVAYILLLISGYLFYRFVLLSFSEEKDLRVLVWILIFALLFTIFWAFVNKSLVPTTTRAGIFLETRAGYIFAGPNGLAAILVLLLPFTFIALAIRATAVRIFLGVVFIGGLYLLLTTYSRNGYLSFIISTLLVVILLVRTRSAYSLVLFVAISIPVAIFSTTYVTRLFTISLFRFDPSALFRLIMWQSALTEFLKHPLTGVGVANFYYVTKLFHSGFCHNLYLNTFAETGIIGGIAILWFVVTIFYELVRVFRILKEGYMKTLNICLMGSWTAFFVNNLFDQATLFIDRTSEMKFLWLLIAVTAVFVAIGSGQKKSSVVS